MKEKPFSPSISFLHKVQDGKVYSAVRYNHERGVQYITRGGLMAIDAHAKAGLIKRPCIAAIGRPSYAELTSAGQAALLTSYAPARKSDPCIE